MKQNSEPKDEVGFATRAVHAGRGDFTDLGVHAPPLDFSSTYPTPDLETAARSFDRLVAGDAPEGTFVYQRLFNPTTDRFERALSELEGAEDAAAFASGMAAFSAVLLAAKHRGTHVGAGRPLYGTADHLLTSGLLGMTVTWTTQDAIANAVRPDTALVVIETALGVMLLAGAGMTALARSLKLAMVPALAAGAFFMLSGFMVAHAIHQTVIASIAWLPLITLLTLRAFGEDGWRAAPGASRPGTASTSSRCATTTRSDTSRSPSTG